MRVVVQRVSSARVTVAGCVAGEIERGLLVFVGIEAADTAADGEWLAQKISKLRIFADETGQTENLGANDDRLEGPSPDGPRTVGRPSLQPAQDKPNAGAPNPRPMNLSVVDIAGGVLVISQFTLHASTQKGTRPSFNAAARPEHARPLYEQFIAQLSAALGRPVQTGEFGAYMSVALVNDGPVTLVIDSKTRA